MSIANVFKIGKLQITTPTDWLDITHEIKECHPPFTLAKPDGAGVIQFSVAEYRSGKLPEITLDGLRDLLADFAQSRELGRGYAFDSQGNHLLFAAASFDIEDAFLRVWYCSDGQSVVLVTYNCGKGLQQPELTDCENIVRHLEFAERN